MSDPKNNQCVEPTCNICDDIKKHNAFLHLEIKNIPDKEVCKQQCEEDCNDDEVDEYENELFEDDDDDDRGEGEHNNCYEDISLDLRSEISTSEKSNSSILHLPRSSLSKTFSSEKLRDIELKNMILMKKILSNNKRSNQYNIPGRQNPITKVTSAAINRRRFEEKICKDNQILLKKIQSVKSSMKR